MTYSVEPRFCDGKQVEGEWVLLRDGHLTGVKSFDWPFLEAVCAGMNTLTAEQRDHANAMAYRKTVMGERAA